MCCNDKLVYVDQMLAIYMTIEAFSKKKFEWKIPLKMYMEHSMLAAHFFYQHVTIFSSTSLAFDSKHTLNPFGY